MLLLPTVAVTRLPYREFDIFTARVSRKLHDGSAITLSGIGDFQLNNEGSIQFVPSGSENYNTASFGLTTFISPEISRQARTVESEMEQVDSTPILFTPEKRTSAPIMKYAAVGLIAIALSSLGGMKLYEGSVKKHNFCRKGKSRCIG